MKTSRAKLGANGEAAALRQGWWVLLMVTQEALEGRVMHSQIPGRFSLTIRIKEGYIVIIQYENLKEILT